MKKHASGICFSWFIFVLAGLLFAREPIDSVHYREWESAFTLQNDALRVTVVPAIGRAVFLGPPDGENLLAWNDESAGQVAPETEGDWLNHGGDWMFPVHQSRWEQMGGAVWPPLRALDGRPWRGEAWVEEDGASVALIRRDIGDPLFVQLERRFILPPGDHAGLRVEQSISRVYASPVPVCLWHITQIDRAGLTILGRYGDWKHIGFNAPPQSAVTETPEAWVFDVPRLDETKVGSAARWIAALRGDLMLVQWMEGGDTGGDFPDDGSAVVMYSNAGLGYTEIETQSVEVDLAPGERLRNAVEYRLVRMDGIPDAEEAAKIAAALVPFRDVIEFDPSVAHPEDVIRVRVRSDEPGGILHWGVNGPGGGWDLPHRVYWPEGSTPGASGVAVDTPLPDPVDGVSVVELGPFNRPEHVVQSLHAVVRWGNRWESRGGDNYNLTITPHPDASDISLDVHVDRNGVLATVHTDPPAEEIRFSVANREISAERNHTLSGGFDLSGLSYGPHEISVRAVRNGRLSTASSTVWKVPELPEPADVPFGHLPFGATRDGGWTVVLHAPNARFVELEWKDAGGKTQQTLMAPLSHGQWKAAVDEDLDILQYRYVVDGHRRYADPWSRDVLWLTPDGEHAHHPEQAWTLAGSLPEPMGPWDRPRMETWVIYELSIPDVAPPGSYKGLKAKLDYIAGLGINAIEPLPVTTFPGDNSWGYNPAFHMGLERSYGTPEDFADLIHAMRDRGIAFVFDIVLNHIEANSPMKRLHGPPEENPYFVPFEGFNWGFPKLDQESEPFKLYVRDTLRHWIVQWGVDGYRYDATQWIQWSGYRDWGVSWMAYVVNEADPGVVQIAENLPSEPAMVMGTELDSEWDGHYRWRMRRVFVEGNFIGEPGKMREILDPRNHAYQTGWQRMAYIESHDEERFVRELLEAGYEEEEAFRRHLAAAAVTLTVPGIPFLFAGQEWGETTRKVVGLNPLQWERRGEPARADMVDAFRKLIHLRTTHRALHHDRIDILHLDNETGTLVYLRPGVPESVLVAFNVSKASAAWSIPESMEILTDILNPEEPAPDTQIQMQPGQARLFNVRWR